MFPPLRTSLHGYVVRSIWPLRTFKDWTMFIIHLYLHKVCGYVPLRTSLHGCWYSWFTNKDFSRTSLHGNFGSYSISYMIDGMGFTFMMKKRSLTQNLKRIRALPECPLSTTLEKSLDKMQSRKPVSSRTTSSLDSPNPSFYGKGPWSFKLCIIFQRYIGLLGGSYFCRKI